MTRIVSIVCSRATNPPKTLEPLKQYLSSLEGGSVEVVYDAPSIYAGIEEGLKRASKEFPLSMHDIIVICHDDICIFNDREHFAKILKSNLRLGSDVGFVGVAGASRLLADPIWWHSRSTNEARGFVFQGNDTTNMRPNYFGSYGPVVVLDGCFMATTFGTLMRVGYKQPDYLSSRWDFYDIHLTFSSYLCGLSNLTVPILIRHESDGHMREGWYTAKSEFKRKHAQNLPCFVPMISFKDHKWY